MRYRDLKIWGLNSGFRNLEISRFNVGVFIFGSGTKVIIFYFHLSPCDIPCTPPHQLAEVFNVND